jgi:hypothetical protein
MRGAGSSARNCRAAILGDADGFRVIYEQYAKCANQIYDGFVALCSGNADRAEAMLDRILDEAESLPPARPGRAVTLPAIERVADDAEPDGDDETTAMAAASVKRAAAPAR